MVPIETMPKYRDRLVNTASSLLMSWTQIASQLRLWLLLLLDIPDPHFVSPFGSHLRALDPSYHIRVRVGPTAAWL